MNLITGEQEDKLLSGSPRPAVWRRHWGGQRGFDGCSAGLLLLLLPLLLQQPACSGGRGTRQVAVKGQIMKRKCCTWNAIHAAWAKGLWLQGAESLEAGYLRKMPTPGPMAAASPCLSSSRCLASTIAATAASLLRRSLASWLSRILRAAVRSFCASATAACGGAQGGTGWGANQPGVVVTQAA